MEWHGIKVDCDFLNKAAAKLQEQISVLEKEIQQMAGYDLNLNSSQQLAELLFQKMNLPLSKKTRKTKAQSTDIDVLNELKGFPIVEKIIAYRTYKKLLSTYVLGLLATGTSTIASILPSTRRSRPPAAFRHPIPTCRTSRSEK